jgi:hypothetical protein
MIPRARKALACSLNRQRHSCVTTTLKRTRQQRNLTAVIRSVLGNAQQHGSDIVLPRMHRPVENR